MSSRTGPGVPFFLRPYVKKAERWVRKGCVGDIEFSESTYQVLVKDPETGEEVWAFLQLDGVEVRDAFCACEGEVEEGSSGSGMQGCCHLAAAWLRILRGGEEPLHRRFRKSLWHQLCRLYADKLGDEPDVLKRVGKEGYAAFSAGGKQICTLTGRTAAARKRLKQLLYNRQAPTEETSIKFSNLSHEELLLWRTGKPSADLRYELAFWSDLAKWMLWMQEEGLAYTVTLEPSSTSHLPSQEALPNRIRVAFAELEADFYISLANWPAIIPSLATVKTPLQVIDERQQGIAAIVYHSDEAALEIVPRHVEGGGVPSAADGEAILLDDDWRYLPGVGFLAMSPHQLLEHPWLTGRAVDALLTEHTALVSQLLEPGCTLHPDPVTISYHLEFDADAALHIRAYVLEPGDLSEAGAALFGQWAYLSGDGFYRLEGVHFADAHVVVRAEELPDFIARQRAWLNQQVGFHTHISSLEEQLTHTLDAAGVLTLQQLPQAQVVPGVGVQRDFGNWFYVEGEGFYAKALPMGARPVRAGIGVSAEQIPLFIRMHTEELHLVKGFFAATCPVAKGGVSVSWAPIGHADSVTVAPAYELSEQYRGCRVRFFSEYAYVAGEGFSELPAALRLPESYRQPMTLVGEELERFLAYQLAEVRPLALQLDPRLVAASNLRLEIGDLNEEEATPGWYRLRLSFVSDAGSVAVQEVWQALQRKKKYLCSAAGLLDLSAETFAWLRAVRRQRFVATNILLLSALELIRLQALADIPAPKVAPARALLSALLDFHVTPPPPQTSLKSSLRPYQQLGVQWLWALYTRGLSGLLCDDMGLGKTHQAMALLDLVLHEGGGSGAPRYALVVCPTSVIYHWQDKLHSFLPDIPVHTFYGSSRRLPLLHQSTGILLTSYGVARNEGERLATLPFTVAVFDEIQIAKNHRSRIYAVLQTLQAHMRLGMTGTPIENHLRELKALFDLTLPTYLPGERDFREYFVKPIEKEGDHDRRRLLSRLIKPFVLRRKKEEVLTDLPPKIEELLYCSLLPNQRVLYNDVLAQSRATLLHQLETSAEPIPYLHIFTILSSLKQICNHPAAYLKEPATYRDHPSGKWDLFVELLHEARHSGQKVLVFSHYLAMLDIMARYLDEQGVGFSLLKGDTRDRAQQVARFQTDPACEVFLGSLQAAGTGIDLTAATVVIHYDRWWNAAKERQATDRAYRIGQSRGVQVFKLVTKDSFEERIDALIFSKGQLLEEVVTADDHQLLKQLDRRELLELLRQVDTSRGVAAAMPIDDDL